MKRQNRKNHPVTPATIELKTPGEALFIERALAFYRENQTVGDNAPYGQVLNQMDCFSAANGPELLREGLEIALQERIDDLEKKRRRDNVKPVHKKPDTEATERKTS